MFYNKVIKNLLVYFDFFGFFVCKIQDCMCFIFFFQCICRVEYGWNFIKMWIMCVLFMSFIMWEILCCFILMRMML